MNKYVTEGDLRAEYHKTYWAWVKFSTREAYKKHIIAIKALQDYRKANSK